MVQKLRMKEKVKILVFFWLVRIWMLVLFPNIEEAEKWIGLLRFSRGVR
jgi:hypothetical protein